MMQQNLSTKANSGYLGKRATSSISKSNFSGHLRLAKHSTGKKMSIQGSISNISNKENASRKSRRKRERNSRKKLKVDNRRKRSRKPPLKLDEIFRIFESDGSSDKRWKHEFKRFLEMTTTAHNSRKKIFPGKLKLGPLRLAFNKPKFAILFYYFNEDKYCDINDVKLYFKTDNPTSLMAVYGKKAVKKMDALCSLKIFPTKKSILKKNNKKVVDIEISDDDDIESEKEEEEKKEEVMIDITEEDNKDIIDIDMTDQKPILLSPIQEKEEEIEEVDDRMFLVDTGKKNLLDDSEKEEEEQIITNPLVMKVNI